MSNFLRNIHPLLKTAKRQTFDDANYAILNAIQGTLTELEKESIASGIQSSLKTATKDYLDIWGTWYGISRNPNEIDESYRKRIVESVDVQRGTISAITKGIENFLGTTEITVVEHETWKDIFWVNKSRLNSNARTMGDIYRYGVIILTLDTPYPPSLLDIITLYKPAGVSVIINYSDNRTTIDKYTGQVIEGLIDPKKVYYIS